VADELEPEALAARLAGLDVDEFLVATASTLASLAFSGLDRGDLPRARRAIDALAALVPQVQGDLRAELERGLASLQVAYATAVQG
jgi:hypothetical protein